MTPSGANGDSPTATASASSEPATMEMNWPMRPSAAVPEGLAPRARTVSRSSLSNRYWRPISWAHTTRATRAAMPPKTARAMASGFTDRRALATLVAVVGVMTTGVPAGRACWASCSTSATLAGPPARGHR